MGSKLNILFFCLIYLLGSSWELNVDTQNPIIITNAADGNASYFGAAVRIYKRDKEGESWIVIGAPRANSTFLTHRGIFEPGVIWRCSLSKDKNICEPVVMDPTGNSDTVRAVKDRKDGGWLGSSLSGENSERFVTCASRWVNQKFVDHPNITEYFMNGMCYWRNKNDLTEEIILDPPSSSRLLPLSGYEYNNKQTPEFWIYAQAGFSSQLTSENKLILGAPGVSIWKGSAILYSDQEVSNPAGSNSQRSIFSERKVIRPELGDAFQDYSYFGYAVQSGYFFATNSPTKKIQYVGGAPRGSQLAGEVVIFDFPKTEDEPMKKLQIINGTQIGSYFGSVLCVADINEDGYDDLLVGAPRYTSSRVSIQPLNEKLASFTDEKTSIRGDEGAVLVYISSGSSLEFREILQGENKQWSQFGMAISAVGDLNKDGFNDIIIGAPYKGGKGSIYIYHGTAEGVQSKFSQVIHASDVDSGLRGFGYSLSAGVDFDNNGYNDFAVGSFGSGQAVILRTQPFVMLTGSIKTAFSRLPMTVLEFKFQSCISYSGSNLPPQLVIEVKVTMDADFQTSPRIFVKRSPKDTPRRELTYKVVVPKESEKCTELIGDAEKLRDSDLPVRIKQEGTLDSNEGVQANGDEKSVTNMTITRNSLGVVWTEVTGKRIKDFCSSCAVVGQKSFPSLTLPFEIQCGDDDKCDADLRIQASFEGVGPGQNFTIGSSPTAKLMIAVTNHGETAVGPKISVTFTKRNLKFVPQNCESVPMDLSSSYKCSLGRYMWKDEVKELTLEFDMSDLVAGRQTSGKDFIFHIEAITSSDLVQPAAMDVVLPTSALADSHIFANRQVIKFNEKTVVPNQILSHIYEVRLNGPSSVASLLLNFAVPVNLTKLVDSVEVVQVLPPKAERDGEEMYCQYIDGKFHKRISSDSNKTDKNFLIEQPDPDLDAVLLEASPSTDKGRDLKKRRKRDAGLQESTPRPRRRIFTKKPLIIDGTILFECSSRYVDCMRFQCIFPDFKPSSRGSVTISMRVSSDVIRNLFETEKAGILEIKSSGRVIIPNVEDNIQGDNSFLDKDESSTTILLEKPKKVSKWIIVGSAVIGILLLLLLCLCFYACGCLERKNRQVETAADEIDGDDEVDGGRGPVETDDDDDEAPNFLPEKPRGSVTESLDTIKEEHEEHSS